MKKLIVGELAPTTGERIKRFLRKTIDSADFPVDVSSSFYRKLTGCTLLSGVNCNLSSKRAERRNNRGSRAH